jgi:hypothetical protein
VALNSVKIEIGAERRRALSIRVRVRQRSVFLVWLRILSRHGVRIRTDKVVLEAQAIPSGAPVSDAARTVSELPTNQLSRGSLSLSVVRNIARVTRGHRRWLTARLEFGADRRRHSVGRIVGHAATGNSANAGAGSREGAGWTEAEGKGRKGTGSSRYILKCGRGDVATGSGLSLAQGDGVRARGRGSRSGCAGGVRLSSCRRYLAALTSQIGAKLLPLPLSWRASSDGIYGRYCHSTILCSCVS